MPSKISYEFIKLKNYFGWRKEMFHPYLIPTTSIALPTSIPTTVTPDTGAFAATTRH